MNAINHMAFYKSDKQINQRKHASQRAHQRFNVYIDDFDLDIMCRAIYSNDYELIAHEKSASFYWNTYWKFKEPVITVFKGDTREIVTFLPNTCDVDISYIEEVIRQKKEKDIVVGEFTRATKRILSGRYEDKHEFSYGTEYVVYSDRMKKFLRTIFKDDRVIAIYHKDNWYVE